jgi:hypothetical protein
MRGLARQSDVTSPADRPGLLAPDTSGMNFYRADPALTDLLRIHLPAVSPYRAASRPARRAGRRSSRRVRAARRPPRAGAAPGRPLLLPRIVIDHRVLVGDLFRLTENSVQLTITDDLLGERVVGMAEVGELLSAA